MVLTADGSTFPAPLGWLSRAGSMPIMPGSLDTQIDSLRSLLMAVHHRNGQLAAHVDWPSSDSPTSVRDAVRRLGSCGLVQRISRREVALTEPARRWVEYGDDSLLIAIFHANVRCVGELLAVLSEGPATHEQLREAANDRYALDWSGRDPVRRRTNWLRAAKLIDLRFDDTLALTTAGQEFLSLIKVADPSELPHAQGDDSSPVELTQPSTHTAQLIARLDEEVLRHRKAALGYFVRPAQRDVLESLRALVTVCSPSITRSQFTEYCRREFGSKDSSIAATLSTLRGIGVLQQTGLDTYETTSACRAWLESGDDLEIARILHAHVLCFGELLVGLDDADRAPALTRHVAGAYGMARGDVDGIRTRLHILRACGLIEERAYARYRVTALGRAFRASAPLLPPSTSDDTDVHDVEMEVAGDSAVIDELLASAEASDESERLELAAVTAFIAMGFEAEHIGGGSHTDVLVTVALGAGETTRVAVDAKAAGGGVVPPTRIDWEALREHRENDGADRSAIVGPKFDETVERRAKQNGVTLIRSDLLAEAVRRQSVTPLGPREASAIFEENGPELLPKAWAEAELDSSLVTRVLTVLAKERGSEDKVFEGGLEAELVYFLLRDEVEPRPELARIQRVLDLLVFPLVKGARKQGSKYMAVEEPRITAKRLWVLSRAVQQAAMLLDQER